jgi:hypothetical protein
MTELMVDERGSALRATWHDQAAVLVLSVWHDGECAGSVRLPPDEVARLGRFVVTSLAAGQRSTASRLTSGGGA